jgi:hypothetical protein
MQVKHILFTFIYMYATQQDAPHRNEVRVCMCLSLCIDVLMLECISVRVYVCVSLYV